MAAFYKDQNIQIDPPQNTLEALAALHDHVVKDGKAFDRVEDVLYDFDTVEQQVGYTQSVLTLYSPQYATIRHEGPAGDESLSLTSGENALLHALAKNYGQILDRDQLAALCDIDSGERTIDVQITRLRRKIESDPKLPKNIQTIRGKGYVLNAEPIA